MIRAYRTSDKDRLIDLFKINIPKYFDASEEKEFFDYLDKYIESYYVVEEDGIIIGSGGINYFPDDQVARISWDIIHPDFQGKGIGRKLTEYRIEQIKQQPGFNKIVVRTTQHVYQFYEKLGFAIERIEKDFWAKGFDLYQMNIDINNPTFLKQK